MTHRIFASFEVGKSLLSAISDESREVYASREIALQRLEGIHEEFLANTEKLAADLEIRHREKADDLERQYRQKAEEQEVANAKRSASLDEREADLERRKGELDDRDNTHARRQTYKDITRKLSERSKEFQLTAGTRSLRIWPLAVTGLLLLVLLTGVMYFSLQGLPLNAASEGTPAAAVEALDRWFVVVRLLILTTSAGVTATFLIRMMQRYFQRHADEEFRLKRLDLDIDRATWLVELALEWKEEKDQEMPKELIDRLSRNLFADDAERDTDIHPLETLASALLGNAGSATVELPGGKANFNRNDLKRMAREAESEE